MSSRDKSRKKIVEEFFRFVIQGKPKDALGYFSLGCLQHNPYVRGGMEELLESMASVQQEEGPKYPDSDFSLRHILSDGDMVCVHTELLSSKSNPGLGGLRQVHLFRFDDSNKIVEYWDITQMVEPEMPNAAGAF